MALLGAAAGYCFAVSLRFSIAGLSIALSLLIAQGLPLDSRRRPAGALAGTAGGLLQAAFSLLRLGRRRPPRGGWGEGLEHGRRAAGLRANLSLESVSFRHALRFGAALGTGVAIYWLLGMHEHGFWIPLTILFVLRPEQEETDRRLILRAVGTAAGLVVATALAEWLRGDGRRDRPRPDRCHRLRLRPAHRPVRALHRGDHHLRGAARRLHWRAEALHAAGQRALATAIGIAMAGASFLLWPDRR